MKIDILNKNTVRSVRSVIILDDANFFRNTLKIELRRMGYDVKASCENGLKAIQAIERHKPDLVLLDIELKNQEIDGTHVGEIVNKLNKKSRKKIILIYISAHFDKDKYLNAASASSPKTMINKPVSWNDLQERMEEAIKDAYNNTSRRGIIPVPNRERIIVCAIPNDVIIVRNFNTRGYEIVRRTELFYIKAENRILKVFRKTEKSIPVNLGLRKIYEAIPYEELIQVSRNTIVNMKEVVWFNKQEANRAILKLTNDDELYVTESHIEEVWNAYVKFKAAA